MSALRELQADVLRALYGRTNRAARRVVAHGLDPERRLDVYRNNLATSLRDALAAVYPTIERLVAQPFFGHVARQYIEAHPPRSGNLHDFGDALPAFLASFAPAASLAYLPDVARLEWAWHAVYHAEADPAADAMQALRHIGSLPVDAQLGLRLRVQRAARVLASPNPVFGIWRANLQDDPPPVDLDDGAEQVLVVQRDGQVVVERIEAGEHALLAALSAGATFGEALGAALARAPGFDEAAVIARHFESGTLVAVARAP